MGYLQKLQAVIELPLEQELPCPWPTSLVTPFNWIQLSGGMTPAEIGLVMAILIQHNQLDLLGDMTTMLAQLLTATELIWMGGLHTIGEDDCRNCCDRLSLSTHPINRSIDHLEDLCHPPIYHHGWPIFGGQNHRYFGLLRTED
jgi:hypothetical protein